MKDLSRLLIAVLGRLGRAVTNLLTGQLRPQQTIWIGTQAYTQATPPSHPPAHLAAANRAPRPHDKPPRHPLRPLPGRHPAHPAPRPRQSRPPIRALPAPPHHPGLDQPPHPRSRPLWRQPRNPPAHPRNVRLRRRRPASRPPPAPPLPHARPHPARLPPTATQAEVSRIATLPPCFTGGAGGGGVPRTPRHARRTAPCPPTSAPPPEPGKNTTARPFGRDAAI